MKNVFITGGAGYIGSILTEFLLKDGKYNITVLDNFLYSNQSLNHLVSYKNLKILNYDVRDFEEYEEIIKDYEFFIPLAAFVGAPLCSKEKSSSDNINKTSCLKLFQNLNNRNQKIIMPTTNSFYGSGDGSNFCDETSKLNPISSYAKQKLEVENALKDYGNYISFRLATVFGVSPRMRIDLLVNDFVHKAFFEKTLVLFESSFKRNYIHIRDVAGAFHFALHNYEKLKNNIYNVGLSDANLSKKELCELIKKFLPETLIVENEFKKDPDQRNYIVSNEKIEKAGFKPKFSLEDGVQELISYFKTQKKYNYGNI